jgi:hypothetical protein
VNALPL